MKFYGGQDRDFEWGKDFCNDASEMWKQNEILLEYPSSLGGMVLLSS